MNFEQMFEQAVDQVSEAAITEEYLRIMNEFDSKVMEKHGEKFLTTLKVVMHSLTHLGMNGCNEAIIQDQLRSLFALLQLNGWEEKQLEAFMESLEEMTNMIKTFGEFTITPTAGNA